MNGVLLINPKFPHNVGGALRACVAFDIPVLRWTGDRIRYDKVRGIVETEHGDILKRLPREERLRAYRGQVDWDWESDPAAETTFAKKYDDLTPVAVEFMPNAENMIDFVHPRNALYVFGPEDGTLSKGVLSQCHRFVRIPSTVCLNLAAAVNVTLWDRAQKKYHRKRKRDTSLAAAQYHSLTPGRRDRQ